MLAIAVATLALTLGREGPNGLDPRELRLLQKVLNEYDVSNQGPGKDFVDWLLVTNPPPNVDVPSETRARARAVEYFVRCAFGPDYVVRFTGGAPAMTWTWTGRYGLLGNAPLENDGGKYKLRKYNRSLISACLLAHVNNEGITQVISLRGSPRSKETRKNLCPTDAERWAMGQPEGIFLADLFRPVVKKSYGCTTPDPKQTLRSYTLSMNLPDTYSPGGAWRPPNAVVGRTLDHDPEIDDGCSRIAKKLGRYDASSASFDPSPPSICGTPSADCVDGDPDYPSRFVCIASPDSEGTTELEDCGTANTMYAPLFVHMPRLANFEEATRVNAVSPNPGATPIATYTVGWDLPSGQIVPCTACVGSHPYLKANEKPVRPSAPVSPAMVKGLTPAQTFAAVLSFDANREGCGVVGPADADSYTAMIRYRCDPGPCQAKVSTLEFHAAGKPSVVETFTDPWPATAANGFEWFRVYPVHPSWAALAITIEGSPTPPTLDAVGFVPKDLRYSSLLNSEAAKRDPQLKKLYAAASLRCDGVLVSKSTVKGEQQFVEWLGTGKFAGICRAPSPVVDATMPK